jgi:hypothetical protein
MVNRFEYHRYAEDCLRQAEQTGSPEAKSVLMMIASAWNRLAQRLENVERPANCVDLVTLNAATTRVAILATSKKELYHRSRRKFTQ